MRQLRDRAFVEYTATLAKMIEASPLAITAGEPAGIGPDLCLQLARHEQPLVVIADKALLQQRAALLGFDVHLHDYTAATPHVAGKLSVLHVPLAHPAQAGKLDPANSAYVLETLRRAVQRLPVR